MGMAFRQKNAKALRMGASKRALGGGDSVRRAVAIGHSVEDRMKPTTHKSANALDHSKVGKWARGERREYR
jgi:hypothetical protein